MVKFGTFQLPHVLSIQEQKARVEIERAVVARNVVYRQDQSDLGRTFKILGEIRETNASDAALSLAKLRYLNDGTSRTLDPEDGITVAFNAKLVDPEYYISAISWFPSKFHIAYSIVFHETS